MPWPLTSIVPASTTICAYFMTQRSGPRSWPTTALQPLSVEIVCSPDVMWRTPAPATSQVSAGRFEGVRIQHAGVADDESQPDAQVVREPSQLTRTSPSQLGWLLAQMDASGTMRASALSGRASGAA